MEGSEQPRPISEDKEADYLKNLEVGDTPASGNDSSLGKSLTGKEKMHTVLIAAIGLMALVFGFWQFFFASQNPFQDIVKAGNKSRAERLALQQAQIRDMMTRDTDADGLADNLELSVYHTSPYLKDSDSDGLNDKIEVDRGTDPNCPQGQKCTGLPTMDSTASPSDTGVLPSGSTDSAPLTATAGQTNNYSALTPDIIRQMLKSSGISDQDLADTTDDELMQTFAQYLQNNPTMAQQLQQYGLIDPTVFSSYAIGGDLGVDDALVNQTDLTVDALATATSGWANVNLESFGVTTMADFKQLSGAQIRQILIKSGGDSVILDTIGDDELKQVFISQLEKRIVSSTATST
ncbi:MAG: thrombospondin type 3 repeat-containing protein [Patescibacteria group bacterium]|jgi:hypothetical protein